MLKVLCLGQIYNGPLFTLDISILQIFFKAINDRHRNAFLVLNYEKSCGKLHIFGN